MDKRAAMDVWERIAATYGPARPRPWPHVLAFLEQLPVGALVLDLGAGAGRHARAARVLALDAVAFDSARALLRQGGGDRVQADVCALPVRDAWADAALLVAVLGTMPARADRVQALREAGRVLKPGAPLLVLAWMRGQPKHAAALRGEGPWRAIGSEDVEAPWAQGDDVVCRRYHLCSVEELGEDLAAAGFTSEKVEPVALAGKAPDNVLAVARARAAAPTLL
ncbi:MAG: class I SAM-dependent methyltransferase [Halobacteriales archaeon]|nr:class I SAM-dependent methyltransferase [Halobacteriales archaeon]